MRSASRFGPLTISANTGYGAKNQIVHVLRVNFQRLELRAHLRQVQERARPLLVPYAEHRFARMTERPVADVVQNQRGPQQPPLICRVGRIYKKFTAVPDELVEGTRSHRERP
jgi:hypothetical protein